MLSEERGGRTREGKKRKLWECEGDVEEKKRGVERDQRRGKRRDI